MKPYISAVMSVYNESEEYLRKSIESILNQTYTDFEFIIILDNPDNKKARDILKEYENKDDRIVLLENEKNIGLAPSLNRGVKVARGKYIARMDADDIALPQRFEKQVYFLENNPDYAVCFTQVFLLMRMETYWIGKILM
jgi:glycosyltransferase involved in cell wall biosynthesis